jgi:hypothetical protein
MTDAGEPVTRSASRAVLERLGPYVALNGAGVQVEKLSPVLCFALSKLGHVHTLLFDLPLIIVHGEDGQHVPGSKHYIGHAVDVRTWDKDSAAQIVFLTVLAWFNTRLRLAVFDERGRSGRPHIHIEEAN